MRLSGFLPCSGYAIIEAIELQLKGYYGAEIAQMYGVKNNNVTGWISKVRAALGKEYPGYCC